MREPKTIDVLLLILLGAIWGSAFFNIKIATYTYDPITLVFVRVFFALLALVIYCNYKKIKILAFSKDWKMYALVGLTNITIPFILIAYGTNVVDSYLSAILMSTTPLSGTLLAHFFTRNEKYFSFFCTYSFLDRPSHSLIDEGVNAWTICLPSGANDESSKVGTETKISAITIFFCWSTNAYKNNV